MFKENYICDCLYVGLSHNKWNLVVPCVVQQFSGLDATLTNLVPCINRVRQQATQGKHPLLWYRLFPLPSLPTST